MRIFWAGLLQNTPSYGGKKAFPRFTECVFEGCSPKLCLLSLDGEKQSHELVKRVMGNLGWDHLTFLGREQVLPQVTGKRWEEPGLVSLGEGGWRALLATRVSQVAPRKGGRRTPLWYHWRAAGQEGTTGATPIPHSDHFHKCRQRC